MLSHYDAVVWYTGDDVVTRELGWGPGNASRLAMQELLEVRDYVNEGGRVLYTGQSAGQQYTTGSRRAALRPVPEPPVQRRPGRGALPGSVGSGDSQGDPIEYIVRCGDHDAGRRQRSRDRGSVRRLRDRRAARRPDAGGSTAPTAPRTRLELVVHRDRRLPQGDRPGGQLPAVRELAGGGVSERPLGSVRSAHRAVVHVVGSRRRGVQAPDADDHGPGRRRDACRSGRATTSSTTSTT